jgi:hypothetical protein
MGDEDVRVAVLILPLNIYLVKALCLDIPELYGLPIKQRNVYRDLRVLR